MNHERFVGLQWRLTAIYLIVGAASVLMVAVVYSICTSLGINPTSALWAGIFAGLITSAAGSVTGFLIARSMKLRLWDLGDFAGRIAMGDLSARLSTESIDEIGWLEEQLNRMATQLEKAVGNLRRLAEQNRKLAEEAGRGASLEERAKLARDLHDTVNQQLFVLAMRAAAARKRLERIGGDALALAPELVTLEELSRSAHAQTRELILQLRPTTLDQQGLGPALQEYIKAVASKEGWNVSDEIDLCVDLKGERAEGLFRIAQEALNNVSKHAEARTITVHLSASEYGFLLRVRDDGKGFETRCCVSPSSVGLLGVQERVDALGGTLRITSAPGAGTEVTVAMPAEEEAAHDPHHAGGRPQDGTRRTEGLPLPGR